MRQITVVLFLLIVNGSAQAQFFHKLGVGMTSGYRFNNTSLYLEGCYKRFAVTAEHMINKYQGQGFSCGLGYYHPLHENRIMPFAGATYTRLLGGGLSLDWGDGKNSNYTVEQATYIIPQIGVRFNLLAPIERETFTRKGIFSLFLRMGYRILLTKEPDVAFISGDDNHGQLKRIRTAVKEGYRC